MKWQMKLFLGMSLWAIWGCGKDKPGKTETEYPDLDRDSFVGADESDCGAARAGNLDLGCPDICPEEYGPVAGCPRNRDGDDVADAYDNCEFTYGQADCRNPRELSYLGHDLGGDTPVTPDEDLPKACVERPNVGLQVLGARIQGANSVPELWEVVLGAVHEQTPVGAVFFPHEQSARPELKVLPIPQPHLCFVVVGHSDPVGEANNNLDLSILRAQFATELVVDDVALASVVYQERVYVLGAGDQKLRRKRASSDKSVDAADPLERRSDVLAVSCQTVCHLSLRTRELTGDVQAAL